MIFFPCLIPLDVVIMKLVPNLCQDTVILADSNLSLTMFPEYRIPLSYSLFHKRQQHKAKNGNSANAETFVFDLNS